MHCIPVWKLVAPSLERRIHGCSTTVAQRARLVSCADAGVSAARCSLLGCRRASMSFTAMSRLWPTITVSLGASENRRARSCPQRL